MTEQELTALAKERSHPSAAETASEYSLAHGYLARLAERDARVAERVTLIMAYDDLTAERDALQAQLEALPCPCCSGRAPCGSEDCRCCRG